MRQIDFIMVGNKDKWRLQNVDTEDEMYTGNDHRTVTATLNIQRKQPKSNKDGKSNESGVNLKSWEPRSKEDYASALDGKIATECNNNKEWAKKSNSEKVDALEKIFIHTAVQHTKPSKKDEAKVAVSDLNLRIAIEGRKYFRANKQYKEATQMAKYAQKLAKKNSKDRMKQKIDHMVEKFKGLKWVQQVKKGGRSRRPHCMIYPNGKAETAPKGMANVFRKFYEDL